MCIRDSLDITLDSEDVVLHVTHVGSPLGHVGGCIAQLGDSQRHVRVGGAKGLVDGLRGGVVIARAIPVSYTHLDVYKRQVWVSVHEFFRSR